MPRIKAEPSHGLRARHIERAVLGTPSQTDIAPSETMTERQDRGARSGAPSVATRPVPASAAEDVYHDEEEDFDGCVLMEVRHVKQERDYDSQITLQSSFMGPNRALKDFGQELKVINDALGELQARGINHVANLPELVLVGDQSSGKSSLMSAIAGLSLPRSSGTCTRCPLHIRISRADEWSCRVSLAENYKFEPPSPGYPITIHDVTPQNKFPPWVRLAGPEQRRYEFKTVRDRFDSEEIETVLRCAQVAILNPTTPPQFFVPKLKGEGVSDETRNRHMERVQEKETNAEAQFSPNTVAIEVKGPDLADLNFYDLPGVFITAKRPEDRFLERVVQNLTSDYISRKNAIILWAVPMNQDAENSYAFKLIREQAAEDRCVGVMTKADLLPKDGEASTSWLSMLHEQAHRTGLGYFITSRQGHELEEQSKLEEAFFNRTADSTGEWPEIFDDYKDRCGVEKLKTFISAKLGQEFSKVLPEVKVKVHDRLDQLVQELEKYPDPPSNPEMEIMRSLAEFSIKVKDRVLHRDFQSLWDAVSAEPFKMRILALKPKYNVKEPAVKPVVIDLSSDSPVSRKRQLPGSVPATPSKRTRGQPTNGNGVKIEDQDYPVFSPGIMRSGASTSTAVPFPLGSPARGGLRSKDLKEIRNIIRRNAIPGQPGLVSASVYEPLYTEVSRMWGTHLDVFISKTFELLEMEIMHILDGSFQSLKNRAVYKESLEHMREFISSHRNDLRKQLMLLYTLESQRLFTKDEDALERNKAAERKVLERHRLFCRIAASKGEEVGSIPKMEELSEEELGKERVEMQKHLRALGPDPFDQEVTVAAYVRGYYLTAASRFIDIVCIHVMSGLFPRVADVIDTYLHEKLGLCSGRATQDILDRLVNEGDENAKKRQLLQDEKQRLDEALDIIVDLENKQQLATPRPNGPVNGSHMYQQPVNGHNSASHSNGIASRQRSVAPPMTQFGEA
ncbi:P-loop containing nucleoside triphosphate hydrolase protein [Apodospora peruviana]|uniref:P-loop containing nucleoside triphosphate hydrolase protein n=1 Tax=Apodospora peruviana TaxID=516989 RepID=A0AAE0HZG8_9PEZI|nr:P-loop containing nucleoside triphosphate hydrolase protein [Apodospora peruviana]